VYVAVLQQIPEAAFRCQAQPSAARPGYREDMRCASAANCVIRFEALDIPVCRIHEATFARWGASAADNARSRWGWGVWSLEVAAMLALAAQVILNGT
jgi:hypothetical protein